MDNNEEPISAESSFNPVDDFNLGLLIYIVNKSIVWLVLLVILTVTVALAYLRYAPRIYEASTTLMVKKEKTTEILGVERLVNDDDAEIGREMRLMTSPLLLNRAISQLPLEIGYYKEGKTKFVFSELYTSSPFEVTGSVLEEEAYNLPIYVKLISKTKVYIGFTLDGKEYEKTIDTGQVFTNKFLTFSVHPKQNPSEEIMSQIYYFKFFNKDDLLSEISHKLQIKPIDPKTKTIELVYDDRNPVRGKEIVETIAKEFIKFDLERKKEGIINILSFIESQIDTFGTSFDEFQDSISNLKLAQGYYDKGDGYLGELSDKISGYEQKFRDFQFDIVLLKSFISYLAENREFSNLPSLRFKVAQNNFSDAIEGINALQEQRNNLLLQVTPMHPEVRLLDRQIEESKIRLSSDLTNELGGLQTAYNLTLKDYRKYLDEILKMPSLKNRFTRLDKMADIKNDFVLNLYGQKSNYLIASAGIVSDYVILQQARVPQKPISPEETLTKVAGVVVGLLLGLILIVVRYLLHNTIISTEDVTKKTNAALLGIIPRYKEELERSQIVVTHDPKSTITEAFRGVRSNLQFISSTSGSKMLSTTSTIPGEGKTFVSLNLAAILSLLNKKVIILDFDMRKPRLDKIFKVDSYKGVSTILSGQTPFEECILESGVPNLDFITSGPIPPNPSELILLPSLNLLLEDLKTKYDYVVVDTPPIGLVTDALEILRISDYPIYVVRAAYSNRGFVHNINRIISENKIKNLSVIINDYGRGASGYGSYYGYSYGYGYGYGYGYYGKKYGDGYYTDEEQKKTSFLQRFLKK